MEALIQATQKILAEEGPEGVTTIRIATRAGVSIGTLYQCFKNKDSIIKAAMDRQAKAQAELVARAKRLAEGGTAKPAAPKPPAPKKDLESEIRVVVRRLVEAYAKSLPALKDMPKGDRDAVHRVELKRMAHESKDILARHNVKDPPGAAHVLTLSCNKVIKDAIKHAPESFTNGRLEQGLVRLSMEFIKAEQA